MHALSVATALALFVAACDEEGGSLLQASPTATTSPTAIPTVAPAHASVPDDWLRFENDTVSIAVPPQYIGGDTAADQTLSAMHALGGACAGAADLIEEFRDDYEFASMDGEVCARGAVRTVLVLAAPSSTTAPSAFAEEYVMRLGDPGSSLIDFEEGTIGGQPAALMQIRREGEGVVTIQAVYAVRTGRAWHIVVAAASEGDFPEALSAFDAIAATFRIR